MMEGYIQCQKTVQSRQDAVKLGPTLSLMPPSCVLSLAKAIDQGVLEIVSYSPKQGRELGVDLMEGYAKNIQQSTTVFQDKFHMNWTIFHSQWSAPYKEMTI